MMKKFFFAFSFFSLGILLILVIFTKWPGLFKTEIRYVEVPATSVTTVETQTQSQQQDQNQQDLQEFEEGRILQFDSMGACAHLDIAYGEEPQTIRQMLVDKGFNLTMGDTTTFGREARLDQVCSTKGSDVLHLFSVSSSTFDGDLIAPFSVVLGYKKAQTDMWEFFPITTITNGLTVCRVSNLVDKPQTTDLAYVVVSCRGGDAGVSVRDVFVWDKEKSKVKQLFSCMAESMPVFYPEQAELPAYLDDIQEERCTMN